MNSKTIVITARQGKRISLNLGGKTYQNLSYVDAESLIKEAVDRVMQTVLKPSLLDERKTGADILFAVFPNKESNDR